MAASNPADFAVPNVVLCGECGHLNGIDAEKCEACLNFGLGPAAQCPICQQIVYADLFTQHVLLHNLTFAGKADFYNDEKFRGMDSLYPPVPAATEEADGTEKNA